MLEPQWVAKLKAELRDDLVGFGTGLRTAIGESQNRTVSSTEQVMASLKTLSNHSHSSFSHVSQVCPSQILMNPPLILFLLQELRHQREEMAHLRERNSQLVVSNEDLVKNASSMKEQLAAAINLSQETRSTVVSVSSAVEEKLPRLESTLTQTGDSIKVAVADVEAKLDSHISQSREHSAKVTDVSQFHSMYQFRFRLNGFDRYYTTVLNIRLRIMHMYPPRLQRTRSSFRTSVISCRNMLRLPLKHMQRYQPVLLLTAMKLVQLLSQSRPCEHNSRLH